MHAAGFIAQYGCLDHQVSLQPARVVKHAQVLHPAFEHSPTELLLASCHKLQVSVVLAGAAACTNT